MENTDRVVTQIPTNASITVVVPYHSNDHGLAVTLTLLQAQAFPPARIVVIDTSKDKSGLEIARRYNTSEIPIVVECRQCHIYEAWNVGIELAKEDTHVLIINDDLLFPINMIDILSTMARVLPQALCITSTTPAKDHYSEGVDMPFSYYSSFPKEGDLELVKWMPGFFFMLTKRALKEVGNFDSQFKIWFGDDDMEIRIHTHAQKSTTKLFPIVKIKNMFVYHFGGSSYKYDPNSEISRQIGLDRQAFAKKYGVGDEKETPEAPKTASKEKNGQSVGKKSTSRPKPLQKAKKQKNYAKRKNRGK